MKEFNVLKGFGDTRKLPKYFPWELLNEQNARRFHAQTLSRLNERGGLTPEEIYCNITGTVYYKVNFDKEATLKWLINKIDSYNANP